MANFFEKLKRGMGIEGPVEEEVEKKIEKKAKIKKPKKLEIKPFTKILVKGKAEPTEDRLQPTRRPPAEGGPLEKIEEPEVKDYSPPTTRGDQTEVWEGGGRVGVPQKRAPKEEPAPGPETPVKKEVEEKREKWFEAEGQLAIDIYQTKNELVIRSAIAGVKPESVEISFERDIIAIRGRREKPLEEKEDYFTQECYWGPFSREIILPVEVDPNLAEATMKEGILTIRLPKIEREKKKKIIVRG